MQYTYLREFLTIRLQILEILHLNITEVTTFLYKNIRSLNDFMNLGDTFDLGHAKKIKYSRVKIFYFTSIFPPV